MTFALVKPIVEDIKADSGIPFCIENDGSFVLMPKSLYRHEKVCKCPKTKTLKMKLNGHKVIKVGTKELIEPIYL